MKAYLPDIGNERVKDMLERHFGKVILDAGTFAYHLSGIWHHTTFRQELSRKRNNFGTNTG